MSTRYTASTQTRKAAGDDKARVLCWSAAVSGFRTERRADASPGEEPVDLAVSVAPSLEVVGEHGDQQDRARRPHPLRDAGQGRQRRRRCHGDWRVMTSTLPERTQRPAPRTRSRIISPCARTPATARSTGSTDPTQRGSSRPLRPDPRLPAARRQGAAAGSEHRNLPRARRPSRGDPADRGDARALPQRLPHPRRHRGRIVVAPRQTHVAHRSRHPDRRQRRRRDAVAVAATAARQRRARRARARSAHPARRRPHDPPDRRGPGASSSTGCAPTPGSSTTPTTSRWWNSRPAGTPSSRRCRSARSPRAPDPSGWRRWRRSADTSARPSRSPTTC